MSSHSKTVQPKKPEVVASTEELTVLEALSRDYLGQSQSCCDNDRPAGRL